MLFVFALLNVALAQLLACPLCAQIALECPVLTKLTITAGVLDPVTKCTTCATAKCEACQCDTTEALQAKACTDRQGVWTSASTRTGPLKRDVEQQSLPALGCNCRFGTCKLPCPELQCPLSEKMCPLGTKAVQREGVLVNGCRGCPTTECVPVDGTPCPLPPCAAPPTCAAGSEPVVTSKPVDATTKCPLCPTYECKPTVTPCPLLVCAKPICPAGSDLVVTSMPVDPATNCPLCPTYQCKAPCPQIKCAAPPTCAAGSEPVVTSKPVDPATNCPQCPTYECKAPCPQPQCVRITCAAGSEPVVTSKPVDATTKCPLCPTYECKAPCPLPQCERITCDDGSEPVLTSKPVDATTKCPLCPTYECKAPCPQIKCAAPPTCPNGVEPTKLLLPEQRCPTCPQYRCPAACPTCLSAEQQKKRCLSIAGNTWTPSASSGSSGSSVPGGAPTDNKLKRDVDDVELVACLPCETFGKCTPPTGGCKCADPIADCKSSGGTWQFVEPQPEPIPLPGPLPLPKQKRQEVSKPLPGFEACLCAWPAGFCKRPDVCSTIACEPVVTAESCAKQGKLWVPKEFYAVPLPQPLPQPLPADKLKRQLISTGNRCGCPSAGGICVDKPITPCLCPQTNIACPDGQFMTTARIGGDACQCDKFKCSPIVPPVYCNTAKCLFGTQEACVKAGGSFVEASTTSDKFIAACGCASCKFELKFDVKLPTDVKSSDVPALLQEKLGKTVKVVGLKSDGKVQLVVESDASATGDNSSAADVLVSLKASGVVSEVELATADAVAVTDTSAGNAGVANALAVVASFVAVVALLF